ncbi:MULTISPECIES: YciI family protein [Ramlibacter]|uniref:YCII-related domain-containing protein n=1 Tax=Ramlibacter aquaticus TaxID=2780094 RepID=A0ABR9SAL2_9BURK|nr:MULTISPECIES: YciI family protein [Ramlibacter]MBE7939388.1 hypothetical protein [Ramlibacter aquaticus]
MLFAVRFHDRPDRLPVRHAYLPAHVAWLDAHQDQVLVGGSLRDPGDDRPVGGLWIVEAESEQAVRALFATDPFWVQGLRERVEVLRWQKAFPDRQAIV